VEICLAHADDVAAYTALARAAQEWLQSRGLKQYVPAAHDEYAHILRGQVESGTLHAVRDGDSRVGFFSLDSTPSRWWPADSGRALYLAGVVVARRARGRGIGGQIIRWCMDEASRRECPYLRLDCHAGNPWLCAYYQSHGFVLRGRVPQHDGYVGCLYERQVLSTPLATDSAASSWSDSV
jgi:GNAT superfamily N-acetyltransferase